MSLKQKIIEKAGCKKWLNDEEEPPCPIEELAKCLDTLKPCVKAELVISVNDVRGLLDDAARQIQEKYKELIIKSSHCGETEIVDGTWDKLIAKQEILKDVLALLVGEEEK